MGRISKTQADAIIAGLIDIKRSIDALIENLQQTKGPSSYRDYDHPPEPPPDEPVPEGEMPEHVRARIDRITKGAHDG